MNDLQQHALNLANSSQASYLLLVLCNPADGKDAAFRTWFKTSFYQQIRDFPSVLRTRVLEWDKVDLTYGRFPQIDVPYLALIDIAGKDLEDAHSVIDFAQTICGKESSAGDVSTWLYYPVSMKYGLDCGNIPTSVMVHYINPVPGMEAEYAEVFNTRMVRQAAVFDPLVSGQRYEKSLHQKPGAKESTYRTVALYDQIGKTERLVEAFKSPPDNLPDYSSMGTGDLFTEASYLPLV